MINQKSLNNLTPIKKGDLSKDELKKRQKNGGIKSGKIRNERKQMKEILEILLSYEIEKDGELVSCKEAMLIEVVKSALKGDLKSIEFIQNTIGEKPVDKFISFAPSPESQKETQAIIDEIIEKERQRLLLEEETNS